jgi:hypothetical protein
MSIQTRKSCSSYCFLLGLFTAPVAFSAAADSVEDVPDTGLVGCSSRLPTPMLIRYGEDRYLNANIHLGRAPLERADV